MAIFKLQRPMSSDLPNPPWLAYSEHRRNTRMIAADQVPAHVKKAMGDAPKAYFEAEMHPLGGINFKNRVEDQPW